MTVELATAIELVRRAKTAWLPSEGNVRTATFREDEHAAILRYLVDSLTTTKYLSEDEDVRDAMLFRLWIRLCEHSAVRVAKALAHCIRPEEYREAIARLAQEEGVNLPPRTPRLTQPQEPPES